MREFTRELATSPADVENFVDAILSDPSDAPVGCDTETDGREFPDASVVGFSLAYEPLGKSMYVPLAHIHPAVRNIPWRGIVRLSMIALFARRCIAMHGTSIDGPLLIRMDVALARTKCTLELSSALQSEETGLKDQALAYGVAHYKDVISYPNLIAEVLGREPCPGEMSFAQVDVSPGTRGLQYACDDPVWTLGILDLMEREHDEVVGDSAVAATIRGFNDDCAALLAHSSAQGYLVLPDIFEASVRKIEEGLVVEEAELLAEMRAGLGWMSPSVSGPAINGKLL